jgi:hypothetical protein
MYVLSHRAICLWTLCVVVLMSAPPVSLMSFVCDGMDAVADSICIHFALVAGNGCFVARRLSH